MPEAATLPPPVAPTNPAPTAPNPAGGQQQAFVEPKNPFGTESEFWDKAEAHIGANFEKPEAAKNGSNGTEHKPTDKQGGEAGQEMIEGDKPKDTDVAPDDEKPSASAQLQELLEGKAPELEQTPEQIAATKAAEKEQNTWAALKADRKTLRELEAKHKALDEEYKKLKESPQTHPELETYRTENQTLKQRLAQQDVTASDEYIQNVDQPYQVRMEWLQKEFSAKHNISWPHLVAAMENPDEIARGTELDTLFDKSETPISRTNQLAALSRINELHQIMAYGNSLIQNAPKVMEALNADKVRKDGETRAKADADFAEASKLVDSRIEVTMPWLWEKDDKGEVKNKELIQRLRDAKLPGEDSLPLRAMAAKAPTLLVQALKHIEGKDKELSGLKKELSDLKNEMAKRSSLSPNTQGGGLTDAPRGNGGIKDAADWDARLAAMQSDPNFRI